jgi:adenylyltransferase/sulfurtransferase
VLTDAQLLRYNRQLLLPDFDIAGQERLLAATVLVVGLGGLGNPAALYLAAAGVGRLRLVDGDRVELSNLQRQVAHRERSLGVNKARSVADAIAELNAETRVEAVQRHFDAGGGAALLSGVTLAVDASDNYPTRFALNRACIAAGIPLVSAAAVRAEGQITLFDPRRGGPCYRCLYPREGADSALSCSESGVLAPLVGVVGAMQALEAVKYLSGCGDSLRGWLLQMDLARMEFQRLRLPRRKDCPDCSGLHQA